MKDTQPSAFYKQRVSNGWTKYGRVMAHLELLLEVLNLAVVLFDYQVVDVGAVRDTR